MSLEYTIIDNSKEVLDALERQIEAGLESIGIQTVEYGERKLPGLFLRGTYRTRREAYGTYGEERQKRQGYCGKLKKKK